MASVNQVTDQLLEVLSHTKDRTAVLSALMRALVAEVATSRDELRDYVSRHPETESLLLSVLPSRASHEIPTPLSTTETCNLRPRRQAPTENSNQKTTGAVQRPRN